MSNHLVSQQFPFLDGQMAHIDSFTTDSSVVDLQNKMEGHVSNNSASIHFTSPNEQLASVEATSFNSGFQNPMLLKNETGETDSEAGIFGYGAGQAMLSNLNPQKAFLHSKRKAETESAVNSIPQHSMMPIKQSMQQVGTSPRFTQLLQPSSPNSKLVQSKIDPLNMQNLLASNKKIVRNESMSGRSGSQRVQTPKGRTVQNGPLSKGKTNSSGAVRSKLREQLAAGLVLVSENQDKTASTENAHGTMSTNPQSTTDSEHPGSVSESDGVHQLQHQDSNGPFLAGKADAKPSTIGYMGDLFILPDEDVSFSDNFFVKDDLLQGNGLLWALDLDMQMTEEKEMSNIAKTQIQLDEGGKTSEEGKSSPENLAFKIEAELFKLFGGVNKKYKEKGRSLLFNLKDRNNPELRERVVSGEITPERLCSMTAEELASKELSEWRMVKAEEFAQMVVLPDTDLDMRRLVKKTHKGEYQVKMEEKDEIVVEVAGGSSALSQSKSKDTETHSPQLEEMKDKEETASQKNSSENQDLSGSFVLPSDGSDLMQGMMVDEVKDADSLPPIISLDEFLQSLDAEPPFVILDGTAGQSTPASEKEKSEAAGNDVAGSDSASKNHADSPDKINELVMKHEVGEIVKPGESPVKQNISPGATASAVQHVWEGALQLSISTSVKVFGVFRSGEKTSIAEWPSSLEIKGRVRLDAFEKFIKYLPNSRSRTVMVIHFLLKGNSDESERTSLHEAIESYLKDDRVGFSEPDRGVELYLCPPRGRIVDMLSSYVSKDRADIFNTLDNGLIGFIVWRKAHHKTSTISTNSSSASQQKNTTSVSGSSLKKQSNTASRRHQEIDANVNVNMMNKSPPQPVSYNRPPPTKAVIQPPNDDDDDSDIPPGFGPPGSARDDDDLPEFNFSGNVSHARPSSLNLQRGSARMTLPNLPGSSRPVDQIRELIHKYGQTGASNDSGSGRSYGRGADAVGIGIEPWNDDDDDDDDMPEWQPQSLRQTRPQGLHQPLQPLYQQQQNPVVTGSGAAWSQGGRWAQPPGGGQYYGSRSRGY